MVAAAHDHVRSDPRIAWAAFHSFLREAGTLILKDLESAPESAGEGAQEGSDENADGSTDGSTDEAVAKPEARTETETQPEIQPARDDVAAEKEEPARESPIPIAHA